MNLPARRVQSADWLLRLLGTGDESYLVVRDPATDSFVSVPAAAAAAAGRRGALSPDGEKVLMTRRSDVARQDGFVVYALASGETNWFEAPRSGEDRAVAMSPASGVVASLATVRDGIAVDLTHLSGAERRRLWSAPGGWTAETTIAWSPDGTLISATYLAEDDEWASIVLDLDGTAIASLPNTATLSSSNGAWLSDRELLCVDNDLNLFVVDVAVGTRGPVGHQGRIPWAFLDGDLICGVAQTGTDETNVVAVALSGTPPTVGAPRPFLTIRPSHLVWSVDVARRPAVIS